MRPAKTKLLLCTLALSSLSAAEAAAQVLWSAIDTKPKANMIIAYDTSTTMQITPSCDRGGCHAVWGQWPWPVVPWSSTRLCTATTELANTLELFRDQFVYGGFRYDTCGGSVRGHEGIPPRGGAGWAEVQYSVQPNAANPAGSYANVRQMINDIRSASDAGAAGPTGFLMCEHSEHPLPGGGGQPQCITATPGCSGDTAWGALVLSEPNRMIPGLRNIPAIPGPGSDLPCDRAGGTLNAATVLGAALSSWAVPHYTGKPSTRQVEADICNPLDGFFGQLRAAMADCQSDQAVIDACFDMAFYRANARNHWCDAGYMHDKLCSTWSGGAGSAAMDGSCVCAPSQALCLGPGASPCGHAWSTKARQQVAICAAYDPRGLGATFASQSDNKVNGQCRQNVALFFTDGGYGNTTGVFAEGAAAAANAYASNDVPPLSNAYVFRANDAEDGRFDPDAMAQALGNAASYAATDQTSLDTSFAMVVNRVQKGVYRSANLAFDPYGTRVAVTSFTVPGHPNPANASIPDETYIGRPSRIAWHSVNAAGALSSTPVCETDWATRAGYPGMAATPFLSRVALSATVRSRIGPPTTAGGRRTTWASGASMYAWLARG